MNAIRFSPSQIASLADFLEFAGSLNGRTPDQQSVLERAQMECFVSRANDKLRGYDYDWQHSTEWVAPAFAEVSRRKTERLALMTREKIRKLRRAAQAHDLALAFA